MKTAPSALSPSGRSRTSNASWTQRERGEDGDFTLQLILDNGVEEYVLRPSEDDLDVLLKLFKTSDHTTFDLDRTVLMFSNLKTSSPPVRHVSAPRVTEVRLGAGGWRPDMRAHVEIVVAATGETTDVPAAVG